MHNDDVTNVVEFRESHPSEYKNESKEHAELMSQIADAIAFELEKELWTTQHHQLELESYEDDYEQAQAEYGGYMGEEHEEDSQELTARLGLCDDGEDSDATTCIICPLCR